MTIVRSGKFVQVSIDTGDLEFILTGLRDLADFTRKQPIGMASTGVYGWDTEEEREEVAKHDERIANYLEAIAAYHWKG